MGDVYYLKMEDGRKEVWRFPDGTVVTMEVPSNEPPITAKHAVFCLSNIAHQIHSAILTNE